MLLLSGAQLAHLGSYKWIERVREAATGCRPKLIAIPATSVVLLLLLCQVIIGAPTIINDDLLRTFNISLVVRGSVTETRTQNSGDSERWVEPCLPKPGCIVDSEVAVASECVTV